VRYLQPVPTHPDPVAAARRAERKRFLGEELTPGTDGSPWLVQAMLGEAPPLDISRDGVLPWRDDGVLPLRHGFSRTGTPASCLLDVPGVRHLKARTEEGPELEVDCAACRAWQANHRAKHAARNGFMMSRLRAALGPSRAA
jgi:hypothetical protein